MTPRPSLRRAARALPLGLLAVSLLLAFPTSAFALFGNGGFESGNFGSWTKATFLNPGLQGAPPFVGADIVRNGGGADLTSVLGPYAVMSQTDANTGGVLHYPVSGQYCAVVNFEGINRNGNTLTQQAATGAGDVQADGKVHVEFAWAAVVQNPAHGATEQPYVYVAVRDVTKGTLLYESFIFAGDGSIWNDVPNSPDGIQYTNWQVIDVAPGNVALTAGDQVAIEVTAAGCSRGGHWGYVYVDHFGSFKPVTASPTVADKVYDGTTAATITGGTLSGVQGGDNVGLATTGATAAFDSPDPGAGKTVTVSGLALNGADAEKYMLVSNTATTTADITTAADIALQAGALDLQPGHTTTVTATATDALGNPVSGELITFAASGGTVSPLTAFTDANGVATATFTAGATNGPATVTATAFGPVQDTADLFVDGVAPTTTASNTQAAAGVGWVDQGVAVTLTMSDASPDPGTTYYRLDSSGAPTLYTGAPIAVAGEGIHTLEFWSVDAAGNAETPHDVRYVNIDTTAPLVTSSADSDGAWYDQPVTVTLHASDAGGSQLTEVQERLHGSGTWLDAAGDQFTVPAPADGDNDGAHLYDYRAVDGAGNETDGSCIVRIDTTPPVTNVNVAHDIASGNVTITFLPSDLASGMVGGLASTEYQVDGGAWVSGTQVELPALVDHSTDGPHTVLYRSTDCAGRVEVARSLTVNVGTGDGAPAYVPQTAVLGLNGLWRNTAAYLSFHAYEDPAGPGIERTEYSLDDGLTWVPQTSLVIDAPSDHSADGPHLVCYRSVDRAGTVEPTHIVVVGIDTRKPSASAQGASTAWRNKPLTLHFAALDVAPTSGIARIEWSTSGGSWWTAGDAATVSARGLTRVMVRAVDDASNVGLAHATVVRIDTTRPWIKALRSSGRRGHRVSLRFRIYDTAPSCGSARVTLILVRTVHGRIVARYRTVGYRKTNAIVTYRHLIRLRKGHYRFSVRVTDRAGNVYSHTRAGWLILK